MMTAGLYRLTSATLAVVLVNGRHIAHILPIGSTVKIIDKSINGNQLVNVEVGELLAMMFSQDLRTRAEMI